MCLTDVKMKSSVTMNEKLFTLTGNDLNLNCFY